MTMEKKWQDIKPKHLIIILLFRLAEAVVMGLDVPLWAKILLLLATNTELFYLNHVLFSDKGFLNLRFIRLIEQDGRKDGKKEPLYFISHELDIIREYERRARNETMERIKKHLFCSLLMSKVSLR